MASWWLWLVLGLVLLGVEILTPGGFYIIFFGVAALIVGVLAGLGVGGPLWAQLVLFSVLSVASLVVTAPVSRAVGAIRGAPRSHRQAGGRVGGAGGRRGARRLREGRAARDVLDRPQP